MITEKNRAAATKKITVTIPAALVERLNEVVPTRQRSQFIAEAIEKQVALEEQIAAIEESAGAWTDENYPHLRTEEDIDRWLDELRGTWIDTTTQEAVENEPTPA